MVNKIEIQEFRRQLRILERELEQGINKETSCCGITMAQGISLLEIANSECCSIKNLAEYFDLDKSTLSRTIDGIVNLGLVERSENREDRRSLCLKLTEQGQGVVQRVKELTNDFYEKLFMLIPREKHKVVLEGIALLGKALQQIRTKA